MAGDPNDIPDMETDIAVEPDDDTVLDPDLEPYDETIEAPDGGRENYIPPEEL